MFLYSLHYPLAFSQTGLLSAPQTHQTCSLLKAFTCVVSSSWSILSPDPCRVAFYLLSCQTHATSSEMPLQITLKSSLYLPLYLLCSIYQYHLLSFLCIYLYVLFFVSQLECNLLECKSSVLPYSPLYPQYLEEWLAIGNTQ